MMRRNRNTTRKYISSSESEDEKSSKEMVSAFHHESSSESDMENYFIKPGNINLDSILFESKGENVTELSTFSKPTSAALATLSDSESDNDSKTGENSENSTSLKTENIPMCNSSKIVFTQLSDYRNKIEEAKKVVEKYKAQKNVQNKRVDVEQLLAAGEKNDVRKSSGLEHSTSSDSENSCDEWQDINSKLASKNTECMPLKDIQVIVDLPGTSKKKDIDYAAKIKRRLNRVRKENQVLVHKVHLLCWIAHGNYVNSILNKTEVLAMALSLIPSVKSYPSERPDLTYLESILSWYKKTMDVLEKPVPSDILLEKCLCLQMSRKEAYNKKMLAFIFVAIIRSLGIQCRIVMSLQVEPLRPPVDELLSERKTAVDKPTKKNNEQVTLGESSCKSKTNVKEENKLSTVKNEEIRLNKSNISLKEKLQNKDNDRSSKISKDVKKHLNNTVTSQLKKDKTTESKSSVTKKINTHLRTTEADSTSSKLKNKSTSSQSSDSAKRGKSKQDNINKKVENTNLKQVSASESETKVSNATKRKTKLDLTKLKKTPLNLEKNIENKTNSKRYKSTSIPQLDGNYDSDSDFDDKRRTRSCKKSSSKPDLKELRKNTPLLNGKSGKKVPINLEKAQSKGKSRQLDVREDIINLVKGRITEQKRNDSSRMVRKRKSMPDNDSDSDIPTPIRKKYHSSDDDFVPKVKVKRRVQVPGKIVEEKPKLEKNNKNDVWVEVFLDAEEKWISVDVANGKLHCVKELYQRASHPVVYILGWDNNNNIKDVTSRYCPNFNTITRKERINSKWWNESLYPFKGISTPRDEEEDEDLERQQLDQPLPKSISEYKSHPLYVLKRHLLKFEGLYPPQPPTLGFIRGEAVYPRSCVYILHSRDIWLKQAKVVKLGEQPYKIVKARPKYDKLSNKVITDQMLEIYGPWQVEDYDPPTAENGIVPKNAFGNVDLFKPCMLPKGTVHLILSGLNKTARKLNIDCAAAIVGFDFHGGWSHPVYDGYVVCKEYEDQLVKAWELEQDELDRKEQERIDKRVYKNWKRLIQGLLIRERLKIKYDFGELSANENKGKKRKNKLPTFCAKRK
ncbi:DNA repair protein complementing XP-C cells homolog [Sitophilus oryzae]|uniref:DNA repair protein complementing XP-C cells homolog n=1 Tax=Sitophilus oryzae TaxID=7048 RepID=A0A6J2XZ51_SITOR|nr:DNA repair protein complementing XP-C cells homolog [Sitophilus oryzae]XP_030755958.1 DNA repair protein complementing XP-C cells homolog [Sitophilus oryzae]XP_030755959.1 DNA repair protein complementing XP-C cells homolog [Sitophilus oryzae]